MSKEHVDMNTPVIEMRNIVKKFGDFVANDGINLTVHKGEIHAILGENGAGKSTLMNQLYGLLKPTSGDILVNGKKIEMNTPRDAIDAGIGMVHQHFMLVQPFTVTENIVLGTEPRKGIVLDMKTARQSVVDISKRYGLAIDPENGDLLQTRPAFGGNIMATIRSGGFRPQMATVRPKVMQAREPDYARKGKIYRESIEDSDTRRIKEVVETIVRQESTINLSDARIIVSGGRAMKGPQGFELLEAFANRLGGAVGASRAAVDNGWIGYPHQVGQTGQTVQADLYIACGISGQIQHLIGMQSCKTIVAIDIDDTTPMMQMADIAVKGDLFEVIPEIMKELDRVGVAK